MLAISLILLSVVVFHLALLTRNDMWLVIPIFFLINRLLFLVPVEQTHLQDLGKVTDIALAMIVGYSILIPKLRRGIFLGWKSPIGKSILSLVALTLVVSVTTELRYGGSFLLALRMGRTYMFYLGFFFFLAVLANSRNVNRVPRGLFAMGIGVSVAYVVQAFAPIDAIFHAVYYQISSLGELSINRIYLDFLEFYAGLFTIVAAVSFGLRATGRRLLNIVVVVLFGFQVVLTQHRNLWATVLIGSSVAFMMMRRAADRSFTKMLMSISALMIFIAILLVGSGFSDFIVQRFSSGLADTPLAGGTFTGRLVTSQRYLSILADNIVTGVGLIHPETGVLGTTDESDYGSEIGSISLLFHFGLFGLIWLATLSIVYHNRVSKVIASPQVNRMQKSIIIGGHGYFLGTVSMSFLNGGLTTPSGIILFAMLFAYTEAVLLKITSQRIVSNLTS